MKRKLLLLLCALLATVGTWAGILDGWTKMETTVVANPQNYYFIILHTDNTLMLGVSKHCSARTDGVLDTPASASSTYDYISYQTASEPSQDLAKVWTIESCTADGYTSAYILRGLANVDCPANIGSYQWELMTDGAVHENNATDAAFNLEATGTMWKIQDATATTYYWGAWEDAVYINNERVAGNAGGNGHAVGNYNIYYMDRVTFNKKYQFLGGTDMNHMLVNRGFEYGNHTGWNIDNVEGATITIKGDATGSFISAPQSGSKYCYMNGNNSWGALYQTVNNLPDGTYSSSIYLCNDINFLFNNTSAESWTDKTPSGSWSKITITNQNVEGGSTQLRIRGWGDNRFADEASLTFIPSAVGDIATAYTAETATEVYKWYRITIPSEGSRYWIKTSNAATLRYTTSASTLQTAGTENVCSAGAVTQTSFAPGSTVYIATTESTILSLEDPYAALNDAISTAEEHTLGFDADEYAPYTNVEALTRLATAKSIYDAKTATYAEVTAATEVLEGTTWTPNDVEKDAVYNGNMAVADGWNPKGWARQDNAWGQQVDSSDKDHDFSKTTNNTAWYYNNNNSSYYGGVGHYTMPLKGSTTYLLRVKYCSQGTNGGGLVTSLRATVKKGEKTVLNAQELGGNSTQTFEEKSVTFTTTDAGNYVLELTNTGNFFFTDVSILKAATAADYTALNSAISAAESKTLGFETGEYAPYNNVDVLEKLAVAKAIDQESANLKSEINKATSDLTGATWTQNDKDVDAICNGSFTGIARGTQDNVVPGWDGVFRKLITTDDYAALSASKEGRAMFSHEKTYVYGRQTGYTMPLKRNTKYALSFKAAGWENGNIATVSAVVKKPDGSTLKTLNITPTKRINEAESLVSGSIDFTVETSGNYTLEVTVPASTLAVITDFSVERLGIPVLMQVSGVAKMGTFCAPFNVEIPFGVKAYTLSDGTSDDWVHMNEVEGTTIAAGTPVLLTSDTKVEQEFVGQMTVLEPNNDGLLKGVFEKTEVASGDNNYILQYQDSKCAFYIVSDAGIYIGKNRCYLHVAKTSARIAIDREEDGFTGINEVKSSEVEAKMMKDGKYLVKGRIIVVKNGKVYGTNGQILN